MEQESTNKSGSTSFEQNEQPHFIESNVDHELSQASQQLPEGCSSNNGNGLRSPASKGKQLDDIGTSMSRIPISGELFGQPRNEDLYSIYFKGISHSHDQQPFLENHLPKAGMSNGGAMNNSYLDLLSNLPAEFLAPGASSHVSVPFGNSSSVFNKGCGVSNFANGYPDYGNTFDTTSVSTYRDRAATISRHKRKMVWNEDSAPNYKRWSNLIVQGESSRSIGSCNERFTLYDRRYEEIGLPLDPHIRIFNATKGTAGST